LTIANKPENREQMKEKIRLQHNEVRNTCMEKYNYNTIRTIPDNTIYAPIKYIVHTLTILLGLTKVLQEIYRATV